MPQYLLRQEDLRDIEKTLYKVRKPELIARQLVKVNTNYAPWAETISYKWYDHNGAARIRAAGASAKDLPMIGEKGGMETHKVYNIELGLGYEAHELLEMEAMRSAKGPSYSLDTLRVDGTRRSVSEKENKIFFNGHSGYGIKGLLQKDGITSEDVVATGTLNGASSSSQKRQWVNKTPIQQIADIAKGKAKVEENEIFTATTLVLPTTIKEQMILPISDSEPMTILKWLRDEGVYFQKVLFTSALNKENHALGSDVFVIFDDADDVIELATPSDLRMTAPVYDVIGNVEMAAILRTAGCVLRYPSAVYVGKGIARP
jgi:hypothetical protein